MLGIRHPTRRECYQGFRKNWYEGDAHERHLKNVKERKHLARNFAREYVYNYLQTHPCTQCGEADIRVLEFHHVAGKDMPIASMVAGGIPLNASRLSWISALSSAQIVIARSPWTKGAGLEAGNKACLS